MKSTQVRNQTKLQRRRAQKKSSYHTNKHQGSSNLESPALTEVPPHYDSTSLSPPPPSLPPLSSSPPYLPQWQCQDSSHGIGHPALSSPPAAQIYGPHCLLTNSSHSVNYTLRLDLQPAFPTYLQP